MKILLRSKVKGQRSKGFPFTFELSALSYMGRIFLLLASCFLLLPVSHSFAETSNDPVLAIQSTYQSIADLRADFTQSTHVAVLETTIKSTGIFSMKKPGLVRIEYTGAHPKQYLSNGKKLWIIDPELNQVETFKVSGNTVPKEALELLNGFGEMEKLFNINMFKPKVQVKDYAYLKLAPKATNAQYEYLECTFGPDHLLKSMAINNKSGNISTYVFSNIKVNVGLGDELFTYK